DKQTAKNLPSVAPANPDFPNLLPAVNYDGSGPTIDWNDISPRVSATYALDQARKSIVRASYARYAGQLNPGQVTLASPVGSYYTYISYKWVDLNGDHLAQKNEVLTNLAPLYAGSGIDLSVNKRLADRWFARVAFSYNNYVEHPGTGSIQNPTRTDAVNASLALAGPQVDGGQYAPRSGGSGKGDIFYNAKWQINANG